MNRLTYWYLEEREKPRGPSRASEMRKTLTVRPRSPNLYFPHIFKPRDSPSSFDHHPSFLTLPVVCSLSLRIRRSKKAETSYLLQLLFIIWGIFFLFVHCLEVTWQSRLPGQLLPLPDGVSVFSDPPILQESCTC